MEENLVLITDLLHPTIQRGYDIQYQNILTFRSGCSCRAKLEEWMHSEGMSAYKIIEFGSLEAILGCVSAGFGISLLPQSVVERYEQNGALRTHSICNEFSKINTVFIRHCDSILTSAMKEFLHLAYKNNR